MSFRALFGVFSLLAVGSGCDMVRSFGPEEVDGGQPWFLQTLPSEELDGSVQVEDAGLPLDDDAHYRQVAEALSAQRQRSTPQHRSQLRAAGRRLYWIESPPSTPQQRLVSQLGEGPVIRYEFSVLYPFYTVTYEASETHVVRVESAGNGVVYRMYDASHPNREVGSVSVELTSGERFPFSVSGQTLWLVDTKQERLLRWTPGEPVATPAVQLTAAGIQRSGAVSSFSVQGDSALLGEGLRLWKIDLGTGQALSVETAAVVSGGHWDSSGTCFVDHRQLYFVPSPENQPRVVSEELKSSSFRINPSYAKVHWYYEHDCAYWNGRIYYYGMNGIFEYQPFEQRVRPILLRSTDPQKAERFLGFQITDDGMLHVEVVGAGIPVGMAEVHALSLASVPTPPLR